MNPKSERQLLPNKVKFLEIYAPFIRHTYATRANLQANNDRAAKVLHNKSRKIILKSMFGDGVGIEVLSIGDFDPCAIIERLSATGNDFVEEYVIQHRDIVRLSPSGLNMLRIITQLNNKSEVEILGAILRISVNCAVDNWHAGNIAAPVNPTSDTIKGPAFYMDIAKPDEYYHPATKVEILGFRIPYWKESLQLAKDAALYNNKNRSIGWDVAVTDDGPTSLKETTTGIK